MGAVPVVVNAVHLWRTRLLFPVPHFPLINCPFSVPDSPFPVPPDQPDSSLLDAVRIDELKIVTNSFASRVRLAREFVRLGR